MESGAVLLLVLMMVHLAVKAKESPANPLDCREDEYLDDQGKCSPCKECGPGFELSQECGYGEGRNAPCTPCPPRRFKDGWGHHGCKPCFSCPLINRAQKSNCTATSDATCAECSPGFYSKTQIGGFQDLECVPCTKQTPSSEQQCTERLPFIACQAAGLSGLRTAGSSPDPGQGLALVVLMSSTLVLLGLVLLTFSILYCQRFWKSQCQWVFLRSRNDAGQRATLRAFAVPPAFLGHDPGSIDCQSFHPFHRPMAGPVQAVPFAPGVGLPGFHRPLQEDSLDMTKPKEAASKPPPCGSLVEAQPLIRNSGRSDGSARGSFLAEFRQDCGGDPNPGGTDQLAFCASELQHCWPHTPVECTELDLQAFSTQTRKGSAETELTGQLELPLEPPPACDRGLSSRAMDSPLKLADQDLSSQGRNGLSLVEEIAAVTQDTLLLSLALQLDPPLPTFQNVILLGLELGLPSHQLSQMSGFLELVAFTASSGSCSLSVVRLACALQKLRHFDALHVLYNHLAGNLT